MRLNNDQISSASKSFPPQRLKALQSADPGIHAIAIGAKRSGKEQQPMLDDAVIFFVEKKEPPHSLPASREIPHMVEVNVDGQRTLLPTDIVEAPRFEFAACTTTRPTQGGNCIAPADSGISGTLGGIVIDPQGQRYIVSASHVLSNYGTAPMGQQIRHPHTGTEIATLDSHGVRWPSRPGPMGADVALAKVTVASDVDGQVIAGFGIPTGQASPVRDMTVQVMGARMAKPRTAVIELFFPTADVRQLLNVYTFSNVFVTARISARGGGDSGALAVDTATGAVVGLLFAHNEQYSVYAGMGEMAQALGVDGTWSWGSIALSR